MWKFLAILQRLPGEADNIAIADSKPFKSKVKIKSFRKNIKTNHDN